MGRMRRVSLFFVMALLVGVIASVPSRAIVSGTNTLVSYSATSATTSAGSGVGHLSEDGNIVIWATSAHNIIPSDPYSSSSATVLYKRDLRSGATSYVTVDMSGTPVNVDNQNFAVSRTGRYVVFSTDNTNMVSSPSVPSTPTYAHTYLRDTILNTTILVDKDISGILANSLSSAWDVSEDGRFVIFKSQANNLLTTGNPSSPNSGYYYIKDILTGQVINPTVSNTGARANSSTGPLHMSCDGSLVTFSSNATNLTPQDNGNSNTYLVDLRNGYNISNLTYNSNQGASSISISCNGRYIIHGSTSTNLTTDTVTGSPYHYFRYDRLTGTYSLVDKSNSGYISTTQSPGNGIYNNAGKRLVSDNGLVVFLDNDKNMISPAALNTNEVYLRNPEAGTTELVPVNASGIEQSPINTSAPVALEINARGDSVLYSSQATNLVPGVTSGAQMLVLSSVR